ALLFAVTALTPSILGTPYYGVKVGNLRNDLHKFGGEVWLANETALLITNWNQRLSPGSGGLCFYFLKDKASAKADQLCKVITAPGGDYCKPIEDHLINESNGDVIAVVIPGGYKKWKRFAVVANDDKVSDVYLRNFL
uniref:Uncharacterized protein n=1 Tax=Parascaris univalens TaxID=6257 RepID=A0A914ZFZ1_PARUN